jgi:hypothetical protein
LFLTLFNTKQSSRPCNAWPGPERFHQVLTVGNRGARVMQGCIVCVQHLFSNCVGIATQHPHSQHSGTFSGFSSGSGWSGAPGNSLFTTSANVAGWRCIGHLGWRS